MYTIPGSEKIQNPDGTYGIKTFGLGLMVRERETTGKVKTMIDSGLSPSDVVVDVQGKVYTGKNLEDLKKNDISMRFGDANQRAIKTSKPGEWIELDADKFRDYNGEVVYPMGAYESGGKMWAPRASVEKLNVSVDDLKATDPISLPRSMTDLVSDKSIPYKPYYMTGDQYMEAPEGMKFATDKKYYDLMQEYDKNRDKAIQKDLFFKNPGESPSFIGEASHAFARSIGVAGSEIGLAPVAAINSLSNLLTAGILHAQGDEEGSQKYIDAAKGKHGELALPGLGEHIEEAINEGGFWNLDKYNANPNATGWQKAAGFGGHLAGDLVGFAGQMALLGPLGFDAAIEKAGASMGKLLGYEKQIQELMKVSGNSPEILALLKKQAIVTQMLRAPLEFTALAAMQGKVSPTELGEAALTGLMVGKAGTVGRGLRIPFFGSAEETTVQFLETGGYKIAKGASKMDPWYPDWKRLGAAGMAALGMGAIDTIRKRFDGKSWEEIQAMWKDPEQAANMIAFAVMPMLGQKSYREIPYSETLKGQPTLSFVPERFQQEGAIKARTEMPPMLSMVPESTLKEGMLKRRMASDIGMPKGIEEEGGEPPIDVGSLPSWMRTPKRIISLPGDPKSDTMMSIPSQAEPMSLGNLRAIQSRFMELLSKDKRSPDEDMEFNNSIQTLINPDLNKWTKEALAMRAEYVAKRINDGKADPGHFAEFTEIMKMLKDPEPSKGIFFQDVIAKEKESAPALIEQADAVASGKTVKAEETTPVEGVQPEPKVAPQAVEALAYAKTVERKYRGMASDYLSKKEIATKRGFQIRDSNEVSPGKFKVDVWFPQNHEVKSFTISAKNSSIARTEASEMAKDLVRQQEEEFHEDISATEEAYDPHKTLEQKDLLEQLSTRVSEGLKNDESFGSIVDKAAQDLDLDKEAVAEYAEQVKDILALEKRGEIDKAREKASNLGCEWVLKGK
jgi:hypothetical protein